MAACARVIGVPARVGLCRRAKPPHLAAALREDKTDTFIWHSYTELYLAGRWVKATPAFDSALCDRIGIKPLEFDGETDSLFQPFDQAGRRHMEYLNDRGAFADVPFDTIVADFSHELSEHDGQRGPDRRFPLGSRRRRPSVSRKRTKKCDSPALTSPACLPVMRSRFL